MMKNCPLTQFSILLGLTLLLCPNLGAQNYCASKGNSPWQEWIANVQFNGINNSSSKEGYGNFSNQVAILERSSMYHHMTITRGFSWEGDPANAQQEGRVWIDFNQNGIFEANELAGSFSRNVSTFVVETPTWATFGYTRMRIALKTNGLPTPCEIFDRGEVEDYTVRIIGRTISNLPDLTMANLNLVNQSIPKGGVLRYHFDLKNYGTVGIPGNFNVKGYISQDKILSPDDIQDGIVPTGNFAAGFSALQVAGASTIPSTVAAGQYYLILKADPENQVFENNEFDNEIVSLPFQVTAAAPNSCRYEDSLQLVRLYHATNGGNWIYNWNLNLPLEFWAGVGLNANGCVSFLNMDKYGLIGTLPDLQLPNLEVLLLRGNALSGAIPNLNCPKLTGLYLADSRFTGTIPDLNCPNLSVLMLYNNQLSGPIPPLNYPKMTALHLDGNQFTGTIPNFNYPLLHELYLGNNLLTGEIPNFNSPNLAILALNQNRLSGNLPILNYPYLNELYLNDNQFGGCIPNSYQALCGKKVNLSNNPALTNQDFTTFCSANHTGICPLPNTYCASKGNLPWEQWIQNVGFTFPIVWNNSSAKEGYGNFTELTPVNLARGNVTEIAITPQSSWIGNPLNANLFWSVWVDWNQDNDFDDAGEQVIQRPIHFASNLFLDNTHLITVPATALLGKTRMRVAMKMGGYPSVCETFEKGEVEDYTVNITNTGGFAKANVSTKGLNSIDYDFNIFPNPATKEAFLDLKDFEKERVEISISDVAGKVILNQVIENATVAPHHLNTAFLKNGTYFIEIQSVGKRVTRKLRVLN
jgi:GEVED domain/Secretion system C-terminal sorting domain/CARDB